jgi:hypothetical protein
MAMSPEDLEACADIAAKLAAEAIASESQFDALSHRISFMTYVMYRESRSGRAQEVPTATQATEPVDDVATVARRIAGSDRLATRQG